MRGLSPAPAALLLLLLGVAAGPAPSGGEETDQFGRRHEIRGPSETYTVVDFAAAWCKPCYSALPEIARLAGEHPGIRFLIVSVDETKEGRDKLVADLALRIPVIWDEHHRIVESFAPGGFPATYVLDREGKVIHAHTGYSREKTAALERFLEASDPARND